MTSRNKALAEPTSKLASLGGGFSLLTPEQQTKLSWAKTVKFRNEVPEVYRDSFESSLGDATRFPYTALTPSYASFMTRAKEKLICCLDDKIIVLDQVGGYSTSTCYRVEDISYVQVGSALLQSWVKIRGVTSDGVLTSSEFKFNKVTEYVFTPIVEKLRPAADCSAVDPRLERSKFDYLNRSNFKLMNFARRSIMPGAQVAQIILQPEIRVAALMLLGRSFFKTLGASHLTVLTDKELILVQDGVGKRWGRDVRYGGIWHYIPLDKITSISLASTQDDLLTMTIHLPGDDHIDSLFSIPNRREVDLLQQFYSSRRR